MGHIRESDEEGNNLWLDTQKIGQDQTGLDRMARDETGQRQDKKYQRIRRLHLRSPRYGICMRNLLGWLRLGWLEIALTSFKLLKLE